MREIYEELAQMAADYEPGALATIISTRGPTARTAGTQMIIRAGYSVGTIGGGPFEAAVKEAAMVVMRAGEPKLVTLGLADDLRGDATSGDARIDVFLESITRSPGAPETAAAALVAEILRATASHETVALATVVQSEVAVIGPGMKLVTTSRGTHGPLAGTGLVRSVVKDCLALVDQGVETGLVRYTLADSAGTVSVFLQAVTNRPSVIVVGAGHVGGHVAKFASAVGFDVVAIDDRDEYANEARLPEATRLVVGEMPEMLAREQIDGNTYIVIVTRAHKLAEDCLRKVVERPAAYIGMIGSRSLVQSVVSLLAADGFSKQRLDAVHAPIGLDIRAVTPQEIALAIVAEMVLVRRGGRALSMLTRAPVHVTHSDEW